jgi:hypothetical protein
MIIYVLFVHKKSFLKKKVCIFFIKNKFKKTKKPIFSGFFWVGFLGGFFWVVFIGNPAWAPQVAHALMPATPCSSRMCLHQCIGVQMIAVKTIYEISDSDPQSD